MKLSNIKKQLNTDLPIKKLREILNTISPSDIRTEVQKGKEENSILSILRRKIKKES